MNDFAKRWVQVLRSGEYQQTTSCLRNTEGYCCLGVACDLFNQDGWRYEQYEENEPASFVYGDDAESQVLPDKVKDALRLHHCDGGFDGAICVSQGAVAKGLACLNDHGWTFDQIADFIEEHESELFHH